jgi:protein-S-isoprenylcysteine O-methyltransferase Ste14
MYLPITLFINYSSPFPWWLGPALQVLGFACLWATRYTARFQPVWGSGYYLFSAVVRPLGILLIAWGWVEICSASLPAGLFGHESLKYGAGIAVLVSLALLFLNWVFFRFLFGMFLFMLLLGFPKAFFGFIPGEDPSIMLSVMMLGFIGSMWSVFHLGLRRSFLYAREDDPLVIDGPYRLHRHPQLISAAVMVLGSVYAFDPALADQSSALTFRLLNFLVMVASLFAVTRVEEGDLIERFGEDYEKYQAEVPGMLAVRRTIHKPSRKLVLGMVLLSQVLAIVFIFLTPSYLSSEKLRAPAIYSGMNPRGITDDFMYGIVRWDARAIFREIEYREGEEQWHIFELPPDRVLEWKKHSRAVRFSPYPQTLFYCDKVYFSVEDPHGQKGRFPIVRELPFELKCDEKHVELAQAMDYDGDGFPQVWLFSYQEDGGGWKFDYIMAGDDESNTLSHGLDTWLKARRGEID